MKITIEPDSDFDEDVSVKEYKGVYEFALTGTMLDGGVLPHAFNHTHGNTFVLIGKLEELKERLRRYHDSAS